MATGRLPIVAVILEGEGKKHKNSATNMNTRNKSQNLKKLMKETFASRSVTFASQGLILSKNEADVVRNVFLIFIHHNLCINEVRI